MFAVQPQPRGATSNRRADRRNGWSLVFSAMLLLSAVLAVLGWQRSEPGTRPIEQLEVGELVRAETPTGDKDLQFGTDVHPGTWRKIELRAPKADGSHAEVTLLRPLWWLQEQGAEPGGTVHISVPECGIDGDAAVASISPCPPVGEVTQGYRVVTGTFVHHGAKVLDIHIEGLAEPIGTTPNHPFWSEDRQEFVRADDLRPGERLRTFFSDSAADPLSGTPASRRGPPEFPRVLSVTERPGRHTVYNLEVHLAHTYHVAENGVLVHNTADPSDLYSIELPNPSEDATNYVYRLVDENGVTVYYGIADGKGQLLDRLRKHAKRKWGKFVRMEVIASGLTRIEARTLETHLIEERWKQGLPLLNGNKSISHVNPETLKNAQKRVYENPIWRMCPR